MSGLVELSVEKLQTDMEQIQYDDLLFSHTVDEALAFEKELRHSYMYPSSLPGPVHVLTQAQLFVKWIRMERKCKFNVRQSLIRFLFCLKKIASP